MKLSEKNFVKMSLDFYSFARSAKKFWELMLTEGGRGATFKVGVGGHVAAGYQMSEVYASMEKLYGNNLIVVAGNPSEAEDLQAFTVENGRPFAFDVAFRNTVSLIFLTKDRTPFGEKIDEVIEQARTLMTDLANGVGAVCGELTIDGEVEQLEFSSNSLTKCEETPDEYETRQKESMQSGSSGWLDDMLSRMLRDDD